MLETVRAEGPMLLMASVVPSKVRPEDAVRAFEPSLYWISFAAPAAPPPEPRARHAPAGRGRRAGGAPAPA